MARVSATPQIKDHRIFTGYALVFLLYLLAVILFGAWVRITGSGDGCGANWPHCHGEWIPREFLDEHETIIEYTHRITSGILGPLVLILVIWAWRNFKSHPVFYASVVTAIFIVFESLIGAGLVLAELVGSNDSVARAVVMSIHLVNTMMLTGAAALVCWWSTGKPLPRWSRRTSLTWLLLAAILGLVLTNMTGAVTALGDTLFPTTPTIGEGIFQQVRDDLSPANHFLVRLRILHPVVAIVTALYLMSLSWLIRLGRVPELTSRWADIALAAVVVQLLVGVINILLGAPGWIQLIHLLLAQFVWIAVLLLTLSTLSPPGEK